MKSYELSQRVNAQVLIWNSCGLIVEIIRKTTAIVGRIFAVVSHFLPTLLLALGLTAVCVAGAAAIALVPPTFWAGLCIVAAFGWATYPRAKGANHG